MTVKKFFYITGNLYLSIVRHRLSPDWLSANSLLVHFYM